MEALELGRELVRTSKLLRSLFKESVDFLFVGVDTLILLFDSTSMGVTTQRDINWGISSDSMMISFWWEAADKI